MSVEPTLPEGVGIIDGEVYIPDSEAFVKRFPGFIAFSVRDWQLFGMDVETLEWRSLTGRKAPRIKSVRPQGSDQ